MASMTQIRESYTHLRKASLGDVHPVINEMRSLIGQLNPIIKRYKELLIKRKSYKNDIAKIMEMKLYVEQLTKTLHTSINTVDKFKEEVKNLKDIYLEIKKT